MTRPRVVSLLPAATDVLRTLGIGPRLVGVTHECAVPAGGARPQTVVRGVVPEGANPAEIDALVAQRVRDGLPLDVLDTVALRRLGPDLVVAQDLCAVCAVPAGDVDAALAVLGCPTEVHRYDPGRLAEVPRAIVALADAVGLGAAGRALATTWDRRLADVAAAVAARPAPRVAVLEWTDPEWSAGHWVPDVVVAAGGWEVLGDPGGRSRRIDRAAVLAARPDAVLVAPCGVPLPEAVRQAGAVAAWLPPDVAVLAADAAALTGAGPRLVDVVEGLAAALHPGCVPSRPDVLAMLRSPGAVAA